MTIRLLASWLVSVAIATVFLATTLGAATPEETLAKINHLPAAERHATLVREAKNERSVIWYAPMNRESLREFTSAFEADYPFLKVEILTGGPQSLLNRIMTEYRAGRYNYDTMNVRSLALYTLKKANAVMPLRHTQSPRPARRLHRQGRIFERHLGVAIGLSLQQ